MLLNLILDLDQTLVHSLLTRQVPAEVLAVYKTKLDYAQVNVLGVDYTIFARPGLQQFLDFAFTNFNVGVLTHSEMPYAEQVVKAFVLPPNKPQRKLVFFLDRSYINEQQASMYRGLKNLGYFFNVNPKPPGWHRCNTFILDDNLSVCSANPGNCLTLPKFSLARLYQPTLTYAMNPRGMDDTVLYDTETVLKNFLSQYKSLVSIVGVKRLCSRPDAPVFRLFNLRRNLDRKLVERWNEQVMSNYYDG